MFAKVYVAKRFTETIFGPEHLCIGTAVCEDVHEEIKSVINASYQILYYSAFSNPIRCVITSVFGTATLSQTQSQIQCR
jgi:hypothetical protein